MKCKLSFGERLEDLMKEKKINGVTLSDKTGISTTTISDMINGRRENPTAENIIELSKALNVSTDYLLGLSDSKLSDIDDRAIHERTGLSDNAIRILKEWNNQYIKGDTSMIDTINAIFEQETLCNILIREIFLFSHSHYSKITINNILNKHSRSVETNEVKPMLMYEAKYYFEELLKKLYRDNSDDADKYAKAMIDDLRQSLKEVE